MVFYQLFGNTANQYLVGNTPEADTGMIIVLNNELFQLADAVVVCLGILIKYGNKGDLGPDDQSQLVTGIIKIL